MDPVIKKQALRLFTYGLYVVTCVDGAEMNAFTANWLSQVSFEPPLLAVSVENASKSLPMILHSRTFTVNVLRSEPRIEQRKLAGDLGKSAFKVPNKLAGISYEVREGHYLVLHDALAWVVCSLQQSIEAGDSTLVIAEVVDAGIIAEGQPLTMAEAGFRHAG